MEQRADELPVTVSRLAFTGHSIFGDRARHPERGASHEARAQPIGTRTARSAHEALPSSAAWLSLDETDSDVRTFLRYLVASVRSVFSEACGDVSRELESRLDPEAIAGLHRVAAVWCENHGSIEEALPYTLTRQGESGCAQRSGRRGAHVRFVLQGGK